MPNGVGIVLKAIEIISNPLWPPEEKYISILRSEFLDYGCPSCGHRFGYKYNIRPEGYSWSCNNSKCEKNCFILLEEFTSIPDKVSVVLPELVPHPRRKNQELIKAENNSGIKFVEVLLPSSGDNNYGKGSCACYACVDSLANQFDLQTRHTIVLKVRLRQECIEIMKMFGYGAYISEEEGQYDLYRLSIGTCHKHFDNLNYLLKLIRRDHWITPEKIEKARNYIG